MTIQEKLNELGLTLPTVSKPGGNYVSVNIRGNIAYIAIQFPKNGDDWFFKGKLGKELTTEDGYRAMQLCALITSMRTIRQPPIGMKVRVW